MPRNGALVPPPTEMPTEMRMVAPEGEGLCCGSLYRDWLCCVRLCCDCLGCAFSLAAPDKPLPFFFCAEDSCQPWPTQDKPLSTLSFIPPRKANICVHGCASKMEDGLIRGRMQPRA